MKTYILKEGQIFVDGLPVTLKSNPFRSTYEKILAWQELSIEKQVRLYLEKHYYNRLVPVFSEYLLYSWKRKDSKLIREAWDYIIPIMSYKKNVLKIANNLIDYIDIKKNYYNKLSKKEEESFDRLILSLQDSLKVFLGKDYQNMTKELENEDEKFFVLEEYSRAMVKSTLEWLK